MPSDCPPQKSSHSCRLRGGPTEFQTVTIEKLVHGGYGLGHLQQRSVFVPYVLPGETARVEIIRRHRQYFEAKLIEVMEPSKERVSPPCPYFGRCGGCQWQHIAYETQLLWKQKILLETLERIGKVENPNVLPTLAAPQTSGWRSRATFHQDERGNIGFFAGGTQQVVDIEECLIAEETLNQKLQALRQVKGNVRKDYELRSTEAKGFTQVNQHQNENLKKLVKEWAEALPHEHIVELFCGSGNFTEVLIPLAKKITAIDSDRLVIDQAQKKWPSVQWVCTDAIRFFSQELAEPTDLLILDPPRDGAAGVVEGVLKNRPKHILYISCDPSTLARDVRFLKELAGYQLIQTKPVDMFPHSFHIESLSLLKIG